MDFPYLSRFQPVLLSLFRFITGLLLFQYGVAKLFKFPAVPMFAKVELMSLYGAARVRRRPRGYFLPMALSTLIGPPPAAERYKQAKQNRIARVPLLSNGRNTGVSPLNMCPMK